MPEVHLRKLSDMENQGEIELGRGEVISNIDLRASPGEYPVYSSSAVGTGKFGQYGKYMFDESLITWSVDGGGRPFLRKKHKFSVTNVSGFLRIKKPDIWDYGYLHAALVKAHQRIQFDYQMKAHPSVIRELYRLRWVPIDDQQKIAQILDTLDTQIQKTEALIAKLEKIKEGLLHDLLTRGIDQNGQLRPTPEQAPELYKESALGLIPKDWEVDKLTARAALPRGQVSPLLSPYKTMVLVAPDHIESGSARLLLKETAGEQNAISGKYLFAAGDVLYSKIRPYLRKAVLADFDGLCSADMYPLRPSNETCPHFLLSVILGHPFSSFAESVSMRSGFPKINRTELAEFSNAWPSFREQRQISSHLASAESKIAAEFSVFHKLRELKKGLMDDLLTGHVRVPTFLQDSV